MIVDCAVYRDGLRDSSPDDFATALREARQRGDSFLWMGLYEPSDAEFAHVAEALKLGPLAIEDALTDHQRPKLDGCAQAVHLGLKPITYEADGKRVLSSEIMLFAGDSFVVTVRHGTGSSLREVRHRLEHQPEVLRHGPTAVLYAVSDQVVDEYVAVAAELQQDLEALEVEVFSDKAGMTDGAAAKIYAFKRQVVEFRRATGPLAEPVDRLSRAHIPFVSSGAQPFFRDVGDHLTRVNESVDSLDRLVSDILAAHLAQVGVRQNDDMRRISAYAAMAAMPTLIAGIFGMNFDHMPGLSWVWGYPLTLVVLATAVVGLYRAFKRRGWL
ncbi:magnesium and cobalt transport protein CorA [Streptomyces sp. N35]|uniref:magnesium and cobalt transport protein CorA n=1 Tax=Streptomyces sp. N35 TaxID=2795730 RepID=UPI0018F4AFCE|nr:magnesium and cobalt transport protein CorA [Streptomyces sp. N35]